MLLYSRSRPTSLTIAGNFGGARVEDRQPPGSPLTLDSGMDQQRNRLTRTSLIYLVHIRRKIRYLR